MKSSDFPARTRFDLTATIANGATASDAIDLVGTDLVAILMPGTMTGTAISFQSSVDGTTFVAMMDGAGSAVSITTAASQYIPVPASVQNVRYVKVVSGSTEGAERAIRLITKAS